MDTRYLRQVVPDPTGEMPGTIVIDTANRFCYLVLDNGQALRYGVGIGREGFAWSGRAVIQYKRQWPRWTPPDEMVARQPELVQYSAKNGGMAPGLKNPLGARALLYFQGRQGHALPPARQPGMVVDRQGCLVGLRALPQSGYHRSLRSRACEDAYPRHVS
ncbi:ErfK/YbiS/YcfS/YnhG family protein [Brucella melitensis]|nr:ErfK/YbiS/YcfS/YnhG family protein [Brucella melitensis]